MHSLDLTEELTVTNDIMVELVQLCCSSQLGAWKAGQRVPTKTIDNSGESPEQEK